MKRVVIGLALVSLSSCGYNRIQTYDEEIRYADHRHVYLWSEVSRQG